MIIDDIEIMALVIEALGTVHRVLIEGSSELDEEIDIFNQVFGVHAKLITVTIGGANETNGLVLGRRR